MDRFSGKHMVNLDKELLISSDDWEHRGALIENSKIMEIFLQRKRAPSLVGNIYLGQVRDVLPGMQAAFVDIGEERTAYLYLGDEGFFLEEMPSPAPLESIRKGQKIPVQVVKEALGSKGARLTSQIAISGRYAVVSPSTRMVGISRKLDEEKRESLREMLEELRKPDLGVILRTAASGAEIIDIMEDYGYLVDEWEDVKSRMKQEKAPALLYSEPELPVKLVRDIFSKDFRRCVVEGEATFLMLQSYLSKTVPALLNKLELYEDDKPLFELYKVDAVMKKALKRKVGLSSGGFISIDKTEALTAIDVNTGRYVGHEKKGLEDTVLQTNYEAANEIMRQIRLRNIGGVIVIDFISMREEANRRSVYEAFVEAMSRDRLTTKISEVSNLGLVEMTRKKTGTTLEDFFTDPCLCCGGTGMVMSKENIRIGIERKLRHISKARPYKTFLLKVNPAVIEIFNVDGSPWLEIITEKQFYFVGDNKLDYETVELVDEADEKSLLDLNERAQT